MATSIWYVYDEAMANIAKGIIDLDTNTFLCIICSSSSNVGSTTLSPATYANVTNELGTANGYTAGGVSISLSVSSAANLITVDSSDPTWTPTGTGIVGRFAVIRDSTSGKLLCYMLLDTTPADVNVQSITIDSTGVFTFSRA